jgi:S1-C subfamily serine protease
MDQIYYSFGSSDGFRNITEVDDDFGLLFKHSGAMVMNQVSIPLTAYFINDNKIVDIVDMEPEPFALVPNIKYASSNVYDTILEVKQSVKNKLNWNIGDDLDISPLFIKKAEPNILAAALTNSLTIKCRLGDEEWSGSGFIISPEGYALTCAHVVSLTFRPPFDKSTMLLVSFDGSSFYPAKVEAINYDVDVALIKIIEFTKLNKNVEKILPLGSTITTSVGEEIYIISSPNTVSNVVSSGIIASDIRSAPDIPAPVVFVDVNIAPGSSGGMVVSKYTNDIIGMARGSIANSGDESGGVNYCVSIDEIKKWLNSVKTKMQKFASNEIEVGDIVSIPDETLNELIKLCESRFLDSPKVGKVISTIDDKVLVKIGYYNALVDKSKLKLKKQTLQTKKVDPDILIDKKAFKLILYNKENNTKQTFKISVGAKDSPTYEGIFKIIDKEKNPFEPAFNQYLPYWMGFNEFYDTKKACGCVQGIHAIPIGKDKKTISDPIEEENSHGCIRLNIKDARKLYNICKVGDVIEVR